MDGSSYRPQSPDLSTYAPQSPDLSGLNAQSPDLTGTFSGSPYSHRHSNSRDRFGGQQFASSAYNFDNAPTSSPIPPQFHQIPQQVVMSPAMYYNRGDDEYLPDSVRQSQMMQQAHSNFDPNGVPMGMQQHHYATGQGAPTAQPVDPTRGVQLKTSFPVARIKRIMQADEDIGKVAQVTPHVVSRALELFMIKLISASADQARGGSQASSAASSKGPRRILAQHMKKAITSDETLDFLEDIVKKVPDAPPKGKKDTGSDSEDGGAASGKPARKRGKKRKDSGDDM